MNLILGQDIGIAKTAVVLFDTDTRGPLSLCGVRR